MSAGTEEQSDSIALRLGEVAPLRQGSAHRHTLIVSAINCSALFVDLISYRPELKQTTPVPQNEFVDFERDAGWLSNPQLQQASTELEAVKLCMAQAKR